MIERMILTLLLILAGVAIYYAFTHRQKRRLRIETAGERPTLLYFQSQTCKSCMTQSHYLEVLEKEFQHNYQFEDIDTDNNPERAAKFGIFTLPTTLIIDRTGDVKYINYGLTTNQRLLQQLEQVL